MLQRQVVDELTRIARVETAKKRLEVGLVTERKRNKIADTHAQMRKALYALGLSLRMRRSSMRAYMRSWTSGAHPLRWARQKIGSLWQHRSR